MALPVYSTEFVSVPGLQGEQYVEVPSGFVWVVRDITFWANGPTSSDSFMWVAEFTAPVAFNKIAWFWHDHTLGPVLYHWTGHQTFVAPQQFVAHVDGFPADVRISGYQLTVPS